jgi:hypothetical protein
MKTNQLMTAMFHGQALRVEHKTGLASLTDVFKIGNKLRTDNGASAANLSDYVASTRTQEFIKATASVWGFDPEAAVQVRGRGNTKATMAHISIAIHAAEYLSPLFHAEVIKEFIQGRLLQYRDESGDEFVAMNTAIDLLPDRAGLDNYYIYINAAKKIKAKIDPEGGTWNTATAQQLRARYEIEKWVFTCIRTKVLKTYADMFTGIDNYPL